MAAFFECPLRWAKIHLEHMDRPATAPARIGTAVHASTAVFDQTMKTDGKASIEETADVVLDTIRNPDEEVDWGGVPERKAIEIGVGCHMRYCSTIGATAEYSHIEHTLDPLAIEVPVMGEDSIELVLTGTLDRIRVVDPTDEQHLHRAKHGVCDVKTGARAVSAQPGRHKAQLGVYELLAGEQLDVSLELPAQILALQTSSNYDAATKDVENAREAVIGAPGEPGLLTYMADMLKRETFFGNPSSFLCSEKYCANWKSCRFR